MRQKNSQQSRARSDFLTFSSIEDLELSPLIFTTEQLENRILEFIQKTDEVIKTKLALLKNFLRRL